MRSQVFWESYGCSHYSNKDWLSIDFMPVVCEGHFISRHKKIYGKAYNNTAKSFCPFVFPHRLTWNKNTVKGMDRLLNLKKVFFLKKQVEESKQIALWRLCVQNRFSAACQRWLSHVRHRAVTPHCNVLKELLFPTLQVAGTVTVIDATLWPDCVLNVHRALLLKWKTWALVSPPPSAFDIFIPVLSKYVFFSGHSVPGCWQTMRISSRGGILLWIINRLCEWAVSVSHFLLSRDVIV